MIATIQLEKCMAGTCVFDIIVSKLVYWYKLSPIVLLEIEKSLKVSFHSTDLPFGLAVSLRIKGRGKLMLNAKEVAEQWPEFWDEEGVLIGNDWVWKTVVIYYHAYYNLCKPGCINGNLDQFVVDHFYEPINDDLNRGVTVFLLIDWN